MELCDKQEQNTHERTFNHTCTHTHMQTNTQTVLFATPPLLCTPFVVTCEHTSTPHITHTHYSVTVLPHRLCVLDF